MLFENGTMDIVCKIASEKMTQDPHIIERSEQMIEDFYENQLFKPFVIFRSSFQCIFSRNPLGFYEATIIPKRKSKCNKFVAERVVGSIIKKSYRDTSDGFWKFYINWADSFTYHDLTVISKEDVIWEQPQLYENIMQKHFYTFEDIFKQVEDVVTNVLLPIHRKGHSPSTSPIPKSK